TGSIGSRLQSRSTSDVMSNMRRLAASLTLTLFLARARWAAQELPPAPPPGDAPGGDAHQGGGATGAGKLTPVKPPPPTTTDERAYQLYWEVDAPLPTIAIVFGIGRPIRGGLAPAYCAPAPGGQAEQMNSCDP